VIIVFPVVIGMLLRAGAPGFTARLEKPLRLLSVLVLALLVVGAALQEYETLIAFFAVVGLACLSFNLISMGVGYLAPLALKLPRRQAIAIAMEIGIHNGTLAIFIALNVLERHLTDFGGVAPIANLGGTTPLDAIFGHGSSGVIGFHGFFLQSGNTYDVGVLAFFLFQVVFMETAGYIIIGAIAERVSFAAFIIAEIMLAGLIYPVYGMWMWGGGWLSQLGTSLNLGNGAVDFAGSGVVHATSQALPPLRLARLAHLGRRLRLGRRRPDVRQPGPDGVARSRQRVHAEPVARARLQRR
jgi:hypothetical protein